MADSGDKRPDEKGLSARYLILLFLMGVAACAVFFSLGFLVGYNARSSRAEATTEQVTPTGVIPPTVNPPLETTPAVKKELDASTSTDLSTERVSVEPPKPEPASTPPEPVPPAASSGRLTSPTKLRNNTNRIPRVVEVGYTVQVAASRDKQDAAKLVKELRARGFDVFVVAPELTHASDGLYRVQVGPLATREEAVRVRDRIAKEGFKPFIKR